MMCVADDAPARSGTHIVWGPTVQNQSLEIVRASLEPAAHHHSLEIVRKSLEPAAHHHSLEIVRKSLEPAYGTDV
eukprot:9125965-Heterocapsa_arctica.AAC.1